MNQILFLESNLIYNKKLQKIFIFIFYLSIILFLLTLIYILHSFSLRLKNINKSILLKNKYQISTLYSQTTNISTLELSNNISIIGSIQIPKLNISYPILEQCNKELLKISVCKFSGPLPNRIGNLCVAGHNYKNNTMFSNLNKLNIGDSIYITDLNNTKLEYIIYVKYVVEENNLDCTRATDNVEVTLITCDSTNNSRRTIIKAKMKG